jgi:hypothetical protein
METVMFLNEISSGLPGLRVVAVSQEQKSLVFTGLKRKNIFEIIFVFLSEISLRENFTKGKYRA